jgi:hypothetical protein
LSKESDPVQIDRLELWRRGYTITGDKVVMTRAELTLVDDYFATFSEWESETDRKAYATL